ncbi:MAG: CxxxxCH/CxxCH domain-containing protein [Proteobacteria bacterium]|nr:CxxxxCH/CxxCH domain-containing protein [Pseudomonadota bacterium]MBU1708484.1 CxxxxCH/CxxCH domain-containing protein [Pseudomonadota bacterium]
MGVINNPLSRADDPFVCERCHNDGTGCDDNNTPLDLTDDICATPNDTDYRIKWDSATYPGYNLLCDGCHNGRPDTWKAPDDTSSNFWDSPDETYGVMATHGHDRLVGEAGVRQYPCWFCHASTISGYTDGYSPATKVDNRWDNWTLTANHANGVVDVAIDAKWYINGMDDPYFVSGSKNCYNTYCHSDGTTVSPEIRDYPWTAGSESCNSCHGHDPKALPCSLCHEDGRNWTDAEEWLSAMPMYANTGPGTDRANTHFRHMFTGFSCDDCHFTTVGGPCLECHSAGIPAGAMGAAESAHVNGKYHVNKVKDVVFKSGGTYERTTKSCSNTAGPGCHATTVPQWGGSVTNNVTCLECHGTTGADIDDFGAFQGTQAKINIVEWEKAGHGRPALDVNGDPNPYKSGNPAAAFPNNGCWYCHDNNVLHQDESNPFRLRRHLHFSQRFDRECAYCHMLELDSDCLLCHNDALSESLAPQLANIPANAVINDPYTIARPNHAPYVDEQTSCSVGTTCHEDTNTRHKVDVPIEISNSDEIGDIKNQYIMMGVCLKCHDDDSGGQCQSCHTGSQYVIGFDPGITGLPFIQPLQAKASSFHFGYKHYKAYTDSFDIVLDSVNSGTSDDPPYLVNKLRDQGQAWTDDVLKDDYYVAITSGPNNTERRRIKSNSADTITTYAPFLNTVDLAVTFEIQDITTAVVDTGTVDSPPLSANQLKEDSKSWSTDSWVDDYDANYLVMTSGSNIGLKRKVISNTANVLTLESAFPDNIIAGDTYKLLNPVWKGGKFCWDCHDPHGDINSFWTSEEDKYNIFMMQTQIATETDGLHGKPVPSERKPVKFTRNQTGMDYAKSVAPINGICNVCHDSTVGTTQHFNKTGGDGHNAARKCTLCHEHRFTDSHANEQACDSCHGQKPVPRHTAFGLPRDCTKCHDGTIKKRMNIMGQFRANSHHVQNADGTVNNLHCYACHWEATDLGLINLDYHTGYNYVTHQTVENDPIDLVVWGPGVRPSTYDTTPGSATVAIFRASNLVVDLPTERAEVSKITPHCLSCHSDQNDDTVPFDDCKTPRQYAWDSYSIGAKFSDTGTTSWGKYTGQAKAAKKDIVKAYSAHGNAVNNAGGFDPDTGVEDVTPNTRAGANYNVECFDCHSSHGSFVEGVSSSYVSFNGLKNGANLKETQSGKGGYNLTYKASAWPDPNAVNPFNAGAGQCFDCHETLTGRPGGGTGISKPWGYNSTFEDAQPIIGYKDNKRFSGTYMGIIESGILESINPGDPENFINVDLTYRASRSTLGGHMNASHNNPVSSNYNAGDPSVNDVPTEGTINGLCTPCHDPHGVSPTLGNNKKYAVPLLKGTWLTSPYREDHPPPMAYGYDGKISWGGYVKYASPINNPEYRYNIDRITFNDTANNATFISETDQQFAGLCLRCHPKENLTNELVDDQDFRSLDRIHETVKGWGGDANEHYFPCSKCHQAHSSGLPRLMTTNCLDFKHRDGVVDSGIPYYRDNRAPSNGRSDRGFPIANLFGNALAAGKGYATACHVKVDAGQNPGTDWKTKQLWNDVTLW